MIKVKATVKGERDVPPCTKVFDYDDEVFFSSARIIQERIQRSMKINANEALMVYCAYVIKSIRAGKKDKEIRKGASKILNAENVMIGVPETLRIVAFEIALETRTKKVLLNEPIPTSSYIMATQWE